MKVLIFEDEIPAYEKLKKFILQALPNCNIEGWARSVKDAKKLLKECPNPDLIFSDIELLDGNSFQIMESSNIDCPIIFCTAFDRYLFQAFKANGIAYLLKPYNTESFEEAIEKYHTLFGAKHSANYTPDLFTEFKQLLEGEKKSYKKRFSVKKKEGIKLLEVNDIVSFEASGDFSFAYDQLKQKHVINYSIGQIESKLDPVQFFRINRSEIVNINHILNIESHFKNKLAIKLKSRDEHVYTSGSKTPEFRNWIDQ